jgi:integrase/recombinase XerD
MQHFYTYILDKGLSKHTANAYCYVIQKFIEHHPEMHQFMYSDIAHYFAVSSSCRKPQYRSRELAAIKQYYHYLIRIGQRHDHPCLTFNIKTKRRQSILPNHFFSMVELQRLYQRSERYGMLHLRNQVLISLLLNQAPLVSELVNIKLHHLDLEQGTLHLPICRRLSMRTLPLTQQQTILLKEYLTTDRPCLLRSSSDVLLIGKLGSPISQDDVHYLISTYASAFPNRKLCPMSIRQSVILHWLNKLHLPLEQVQLLAGHKSMSSTEKYIMPCAERLNKLVNQWFPIKELK